MHTDKDDEMDEWKAQDYTQTHIHPNNVIIYASIDSMWIGLKGNTQIRTHHSFPIDEHFAFQSNKRNGEQFDLLPLCACKEYSYKLLLLLLLFFWWNFILSSASCRFTFASYFRIFLCVAVVVHASFYLEHTNMCVRSPYNLKIILIYVQIPFTPMKNHFTAWNRGKYDYKSDVHKLLPRKINKQIRNNFKANIEQKKKFIYICVWHTSLIFTARKSFRWFTICNRISSSINFVTFDFATYLSCWTHPLPICIFFNTLHFTYFVFVCLLPHAFLPHFFEFVLIFIRAKYTHFSNNNFVTQTLALRFQIEYLDIDLFIASHIFLSFSMYSITKDTYTLAKSGASQHRKSIFPSLLELENWITYLRILIVKCHVSFWKNENVIFLWILRKNSISGKLLTFIYF